MRMDFRTLLVMVSSICILSCDLEVGDPYFPYRISIEEIIPSYTGNIFVRHESPLFASNPYGYKIAQTGLRQDMTYSNHCSMSQNLWINLFDQFILKFYSETVTNVTNWDTWDQQALSLADCESHVYYATNITGGLSMPELFDPGNSLPFYVTTNGNLTIWIKELQTNR